MNITTDVMLSSLVKLPDLKNVSIIGYNNPTVILKNGGGVHFTSCYNCIIEGIFWDGCSSHDIHSQTEPGLMLKESSNITIQNCLFQCFLGQALVLSKVSGDININNCNFVNNSHYRGHGAAIHYSSNDATDSHFVFNITNCNFSYNKGAESFIYIETSIDHNDVIFVDSIFHDNDGVCIFLVNQKLYILGNTLFESNAGKQGTGIHISDKSTVVFGENSNTIFTNNSANTTGGAIVLTDDSNLLFDQNSNAKFSSNSATNYGAVIYAFNNCHITFKGNSNVTFNSNGPGVITSHSDGSYVYGNLRGIIYLEKHTYIIFEGYATTVFSDNTADHGGAIHCNDNSYVLFEGNSTTMFYGNIADYYGGAIFLYNNSDIFFEEKFYVASIGGDIRSKYDSYISFEGYSTTVFNSNTAFIGGAIYSHCNSYISFQGNSTITFNNNTADYDGGAIYSRRNSYISFQGNSTITFNNNAADYYGGAIASDFSYTSFTENSTTVFSHNTAGKGAAVYATGNSDIIFDDNSLITFTNNKAIDGTTVYSARYSKIMVRGDSSVIFNYVSAKWCNNVCLPYTGYNYLDIIAIDSNGIIMCSHQEGFICQLNKSKCNCSEFSRDFRNNSVINITDTVILSSTASFNNLNNISIIGHNNPFVYCVNRSGLISLHSKSIVVKGITWIGCGNSNSCDDDSELCNSQSGALVVPVIHFQFSLNASIQNCSFLYSEGPAVVLSKASGETNITHCKFVNSSSYSDHGAAIHYTISNEAISLFTIGDCSFTYNKFAKSLVYIENRINFQNHKMIIYNSNFHHNQVVSIHVVNAHLILSGNISFWNNNATEGSGIYITDSSVAIFGENSNVSFIQNAADNGGGSIILLRNNSTVLFDHNSEVTFNDNKATSGAIYSQSSSNVMFKETSKVKFSSNSATQYGVAISSFDNSQVKFTGNSKTIFNDNFIHLSDTNKQLGATVFCENNSHVLFEGNSTTIFSANTANFGAAIFLHQKSNINFKDRSRVAFNDNTAISGGAVALYDNCTATIEQFSNLIFSNNNASQCGGALYFSNNSNILFTDDSVTLFTDNRAGVYGGAMCFNMSSSIKFEENSSTNFINNTASFGETTYSKGNSAIILRKTSNLKINSNTARWNYGSQFTNKSNDIIIDDNGIVRCSNHKEYYVCQYKNCFCENLEDIPSNSVVVITDSIKLSSSIHLTELVNISLLGYNSPSVYCETDGRFQFTSCSNVSIANISWHKFSNKVSTTNNITPQIKFYNSSNVTIDNCIFQQSVGQAIVLSEVLGIVSIKHSKFVNNMHSHAKIQHGTAIHYSSSNVTESFEDQLTIIISNCNFTDSVGIASLVYLAQHNNSSQCKSIILQDSIFDNNQGTCIHLSNQNLYIKGNVVFKNNEAENGAGISINDRSTVTFSNASKVTFAQNTATNGGAIYVNNWSNVAFENNSHATFSSNKATESGGTFYAEKNSFIITKGRSNLIIVNGEATYGGAIYFRQNCDMRITENSTIEFLNNAAKEDGGSIYSYSNSQIMFSGNSITKFYKSKATQGGVIYSNDNSNIELDENSQVWFNHSTATEGGTLYIYNNSIITTKSKCMLTVNNSEAVYGGVSYLIQSNIIITEDSTVVFLNNKAERDGGSVYSNSKSNITFKGNSTINITGNKATYGGAIYSTNGSNTVFENNSKTIFNSNEATENGGCIYITEQSNIHFKETSRVMFNNSVAFNGAGGAIFCTEKSKTSFISCDVKFQRNIVYNGDGGAICCTNSIAIFEGTSDVEFDGNQATYGGAVDLNMNSNFTIKDNVNVIFSKNSATMGGAVNFHGRSNGTFEMNSTFAVSNNSALQNGGAFHLEMDSYIEFKQLFKGHFDTNKAILGGAIYCTENSSIIFTDLSNILLSNNSAERGGAIFFTVSEILYKSNSSIMFKNNTASQDGGAIYIAEQSQITFMQGSNVTFSHNRASDFGGAIYDKGIINFTISNNVSFLHNNARIGRSIYINLPRQCNRTCLTKKFQEITTTNDNHIAHIVTSPSKIELYISNIHHVNNQDLEYNTYYIQNIMLGQKILLDACLYDYYDHPVDVARFMISGKTNNQGYRLDSNNTLITCNQTTELASIYGKESTQFNYSINIYLYDNHQSESKEVKAILIVGLSPCHSGFSYKSQKCECYNASDIVFCSGSSSTIKRGYWFGSVTGKPTVTFCPINYCNFTCCETSNGYYHLSPVRDNQCRSHRSGTACGNCTDGYTLSYDSTECVSVESCTAGQTVLVVLLSITYWIVIVILVFTMMYYKVGIGYLYGITYYYSIVDILLTQNIYTSREIYLTVNILSSFSKIIPQFLRELCLTTGTSGIDQQFIHYVHPSAVIVILGIISLLARISQRISAIISRGIIHVICLLLLLSYTSIASTSLLLLRQLKFDDIDNVYTYLSPDIEYFHDRHLAYGIVALLCIVIIVICLPLLLTLEPFLNRKFNFIKIKPLLDQFQGCYKDKYHCFAGYYMICRLVIITIVIINSSNDFVANYMLIVVCGIIDLIHISVKPYSNEILNKFDSIILHLVIFIAALPLFDDFDSPLVITIAFVLVIIPFAKFSCNDIIFYIKMI